MYVNGGIVLLRIIGAALMGALVGYEREMEDKPAGLRTIMLVTTGASMAMLLAQRLPAFLEIEPEVALSMNPTRVLAALIQGVGFLGAGTIFMHHRTVYGLTTAAALWAMAMVGTAVGVGDWMLALTGTGVVFFILRILGVLTGRGGSTGSD
ncbi:MAG: MgtC/SapB family protein [Chloroflexota bacterium]|nr:MgtC/SapB family protein [Chloroflexota bacterium]